MKILCVGKNYAEHVKEFDGVVPEEPVIFTKPESAVLLKNFPFFIPDFSENVHYELELVVKINRVGKCIEERFANKYYDEVALGIDFTARDIQLKAKQMGNPWALAKGFDGSAALSPFVSLTGLGNVQALQFSLYQNGDEKQQGNTKDMLFSVDHVISYVSHFMTLKKGDLIFTGTPSGVGPVAREDLLEGYLQGERLLEVRVK